VPYPLSHLTFNVPFVIYQSKECDLWAKIFVNLELPIDQKRSLEEWGKISHLSKCRRSGLYEVHGRVLWSWPHHLAFALFTSQLPFTAPNCAEASLKFMVVIQKAEIRDPSGFLGKIQFLVCRISSNRASSLLENKVSCFYLLPRGGEEQIIEVFTPMVHVRIRGRKCKNVIQVSCTARRIVGEANKSRVKPNIPAYRLLALDRIGYCLKALFRC